MLSTPAIWLDLARLINNPAGQLPARRATSPAHGSVLDRRAKVRSALA